MKEEQVLSQKLWIRIKKRLKENLMNWWNSLMLKSKRSGSWAKLWQDILNLNFLVILLFQIRLEDIVEIFTYLVIIFLAIFKNYNYFWTYWFRLIYDNLLDGSIERMKLDVFHFNLWIIFDDQSINYLHCKIITQI